MSALDRYARVTLTCLVCLGCLASLACGDDAAVPGRTPTASRPMDEPRAQDVIAKTFQAEGVEPEAGRTFTLASGKTEKLEVAAAGKKIGVLWLTRDLARELASFLPKHENDEGSLVVLNGVGPDVKSHILVLWETDYVTDDLAGASHSATEITAERRLERDVRDFLVKSKSETWE